MTFVVTLVGFTPEARYDSVPWTSVIIDESSSSTGPFTQIDSQALAPVDADPVHPATRNVTTALATLASGGWYRVTFSDAAGHLQRFTPVTGAPAPPKLATPADVKRVGHLDPSDSSKDAAFTEAIVVATQHITDYLRADWTLVGAAQQTQVYYDQHEDAALFLPLRGATIGTIRFFRTPTATAYTGVEGTDYTVEGEDRIRLHPTMFDVPFEGAVAQHLPENLARVEVDYLPPSSVPELIRDAVAITAFSLWTRVPIGVGGYASETLGDYSYTREKRSPGSFAVIPDEAKALLRSGGWRKRSSMVT